MKTNIKMKVTPEQSKRVQEICFKNGIGWRINKKKFSHLDAPYLGIEEEAIFYRSSKSEYNITYLEEIDADLFIRTNGTCEEISVDEYKDIRDALVKGKIIQLNGTAINSGYGETWNDCKQEDLFIYSRSAYRIKDDGYSIIGKEIDFEQTQCAINNLTIELLEQKLKKKNEILKKARIKRKNQREELHKLNLKLQKCVSLEEHHLKMKTVLNEKHKLEVENKSLKESSKISCYMLHQQRDTIVSLRDEVINKVDRMRDDKNKEIEKLKVIIEYLESKVK